MTRLRKMVWMILWPVRAYVRYFPVHRGKGILVDYVLKSMLPKATSSFMASLPGGGEVSLQYRERIGMATLLKGAFETAELNWVRSRLDAGDIACDIGANIGIYSVVMGLGVQGQGRVLAFEPLPDNVLRLRSNLDVNGLENVDVFEIALSDVDDEVTLLLADDAAYPSTVDVREGRGTGGQMSVRSRRFDDIWMENGRPPIKVIKIDVEGSEERVLKGALKCIEFCRPALLLEANETEDLRVLKELLEPLGYVCIQPEGFHSWNWLFQAKR